MISDIRKQFRGPAFQALVWVGIVALAGVLSLPALVKNRNPNPWALQVNNTQVGMKEFNRVLNDKREWLSQVHAQYGEQADLMLHMLGIASDPVGLTMHGLIREALLNDVASSLAINLHPMSVEAHLNDPFFIKHYLSGLVPAFLVSPDGTLNENVLRNYLVRRGIKPAEFDAEVERVINRKLVMDIFGVSSYVPTFDAQLLNSVQNDMRAFAVLSFSFDKQLAQEKKKSLSDEELMKYYEQNKTSPHYFVSEKRSGMQWEFNPRDYGIVVADSEITRYYEDHKTRSYVKSPKKVQVRTILIKHTTENAHAQAEALRAELIVNPELFAQKAKQYSQDDSNASQGGLFAPFARGEKETAFERAAFLLKNDGDISVVVRTQDGFQIIQRERVFPQEYTPLSEVSRSIETTLLHNKFSRQCATDFKNIKMVFNKDKKAFDDFIHAKNGVTSDLKDVALDGSNISKTLFAIKNNNGIELCFDGNNAYLVMLSQVSKGHTAEFSEVKDVTRDAIYEERARQSLKALLDQLTREEGVLNLSVLHQKYGSQQGGKLYTTKLISNSELMQDSTLQDLQLESSLFDVLEYPGLGRTVTNAYGSHIIMVVDQGISADDQTQKEAVQTKQVGQRKRALAEAFVASLYRNATIKTNESFVNLQQ
jgi:parvulin-like peptidyl-prolyl isomerase